MEYMTLVFQGIGEYLMHMWSLEFTIFGITTSVGALVVFSVLSALIIKIIKG